MLRRSDYHYDLPPELVAQVPASARSEARLLVLDEIDAELRFSALAERLPKDALIVANDAHVRRARIRTTKRDTGGAVELLLLEPTESAHVWRALARASKPVRVGAVLMTSTNVEIVVETGRDESGAITVRLPDDIEVVCERDGELPLPPYIERPDGVRPEDAKRYQTVYAKVPGAIAAPTAGLHFTAALIRDLIARGHQWQALTLHVGIGTFSPVRTEIIADHRLHHERFEIDEALEQALAEAKRTSRPVVAIGTTVVRALEAFARGDRAGTELFITPGFEFQIVDHLVTNFHLPSSSLMMLVSAFAGYDRTMAAYREAVRRRFRFFSYGDAMLASRARAPGSTKL